MGVREFGRVGVWMLAAVLLAIPARAQVPEGIEFTARYNPAVRPVAVEAHLVNNSTEMLWGSLCFSRLEVLREATWEPSRAVSLLDCDLELNSVPPGGEQHFEHLYRDPLEPGTYRYVADFGTELETFPDEQIPIRSEPFTVEPTRERMLDAFDTAEGWEAVTSDGVALDISTDVTIDGHALRLDFDFHGGGGYAIARKAFDLDLPENYRFRWNIIAEGPGGGPAPVNDLEFKLVDPTGDNVWWHNRRRFAYPTDWQRLSTKKRHLAFAWGPAGGGEMDRVAAVEFVVTAVEGGRGTVWIDDFTFEPLPPDAPYTRTPALSASAGDAGRALDGDPATAWEAPEGEHALTIDFLQEREFGGLVLSWGDAHAADYDVETSSDGEAWQTAFRVRDNRGGRDFIPLPESESRYVRLRLAHGGGGGYALREVEVLPVEAGASGNAFFREVARRAPPGRYPRFFDDEQVYWTVVGVDGDQKEAMVGEDGRVEVENARFSIEPFLFADGRLLGWREADSTTHALAGGVLPIPSVTRHHGGLALTVTAFADGEPGASTLFLRYRVENRRAATDSVRLFLALRPFQVNPPWQFLNTPGGVAPIRSTRVEGGAVRVDDKRIVPLAPPAASGAAAFAEGDVTEWLAEGTLPIGQAVDDPAGYASGALAYGLVLPAGGAAEVVLAVPFHDAAPSPSPSASLVAAAERVAERQATVEAEWAEKLGRVQITLPPEAEAIARAIRSTVGYVLVNRDGAGIQPGSRAYDRSWIRDGALTSSALLRLGYPEAAVAFAEWFAPFQFESGKVPCCVNELAAGYAPDAVPENDSHGQLIFLVAEIHRFTGDDAFLRRMWPHVEAAVAYMDTLRHQRMTPRYAADSLRAFYGLLPESISHEGYSAKPMHSFWDQLFALKGYEDAVYIAEALGEDAARFRQSRDAFARDLAAAYRRTMAMHGIDYLPGAVELGDFDPTSVTVALDPVDTREIFPEGALEATFERYWQHFERRRSGKAAWREYTPYEWRNVGTLVRLGWKERAHEALAWFFGHRRPAAWNQWGEVVWHDERAPQFVGDMPHTWVGSDFIRAVTDFFAYEEGDRLVLGAGIPAEWAWSETGVGVRGLRTHHGPLTYTLRGEGATAAVEIEGGLDVPPGGVVVLPPREGARAATIEGEPADLGARGAVTVRALPAHVVFTY